MSCGLVGGSNTDKQTGLLMLISGVATYFIRAPWILPLVMLFGDLVSILCRGENDIWNRTRLSPQWRYLIIFLLLGGGTFLLAAETDFRVITIFECFYRYGYLIFGGGQVVVPLNWSRSGTI